MDCSGVLRSCATFPIKLLSLALSFSISCLSFSACNATMWSSYRDYCKRKKIKMELMNERRREKEGNQSSYRDCESKVEMDVINIGYCGQRDRQTDR